MKLLIASRNEHKIEEIRAVFSLPALEMIAASRLPGLPDVEEDAATFEGNAVKKAVTLALASGLWTLADDSGLDVDALGGAPGVRSARYAGESCDYSANNIKLLAELENRSMRTARFHCVVALSSPGGRAQTVEGVCEGSITRAPRGTGGFGYDPLFVPENHTKTFAELASQIKNSISHRGRALQKASERWGDMLSLSLRDWPARS